VTIVPVIFEDETATGFRPVGWSVPVGELRCGLLCTRERVELVTGASPILLVRSFLAELAGDCGHTVGIDAVREALDDGARLLLVSPRIGANWQLLDEIVAAARSGMDLAWRDGEGWLALAAAGKDADALATSWQRWQAEADASGCWRFAEVATPLWDPPAPAPARMVDGAWTRIWDLVPATAGAIAADLGRLGAELPPRRLWGAVPADPADAPWMRAITLGDLDPRDHPGVHVMGAAPVRVGPDCDIAPGVAIDASEGPVVLGGGVRILPQSYLAGPLFIGSGSTVKAGTSIAGETSIGAVCKVAGEIGESTFLDFVNKQHDGFIGHAYLASWCNLGAMTTCSDLKNTYGEIKVDLGAGPEPTGQQFVGVLMGEHAKTAIGTLFNTGTTVGFASNVFGAGFPEKALPCFTWGDGREATRMDHRRALAIARTVMLRRHCRMTAGHERVFEQLAV
jgi:UDP-N-acetylglucosamine diphosphorylase/glucosamine-1-phosphate N-acetyltransferase